MGDLGHMLRLIFKHPLTADQPIGAIGRFMRWQIASRLAGAAMVVPLVDEAILVIRTGMTGATGNFYVGLMEFEDMSFLLHLLTEQDLFGDIGANVGVYTVLASAVRGARTIAVEPVPAAVDGLRRNIAINSLGDLVEIRECGVGARREELYFRTDQDAMNHVASNGDGVRIPVLPPDEIFASRTPVLLKIDVEGYEACALRGAQRILRDPALKAIIIELNGLGARYGADDSEVDAEIRDLGFDRVSYDPWTRSLRPTEETQLNNRIYVRDLDFVENRIKSAKPFHVLYRDI